MRVGVREWAEGKYEGDIVGRYRGNYIELEYVEIGGVKYVAVGSTCSYDGELGGRLGVRVKLYGGYLEVGADLTAAYVERLGVERGYKGERVEDHYLMINKLSYSLFGNMDLGYHTKKQVSDREWRETVGLLKSYEGRESIIGDELLKMIGKGYLLGRGYVLEQDPYIFQYGCEKDWGELDYLGYLVGKLGVSERREMRQGYKAEEELGRLLERWEQDEVVQVIRKRLRGILGEQGRDWGLESVKRVRIGGKLLCKVQGNI